MSSLIVRLFGGFNLCCGDEVLDDLIPGKAKELFCYLMKHRQRPIGREFLASVLWDDCTAQHSRQYLRKSLWQVQSTLAKFAGAQPILKVDGQWVSINPGADIWVDVTEFERICAGAHGRLSPEGFSPLKAREVAVDLYRGDFLEGWYQDWCLYDRERLQNIYLVVLDKVVAQAELNHEYENGIEYANRILRSDRTHENAHQHLMRLRYLSGDRAGALRQYVHGATALKEEVGIQPFEQPSQLYQRICEDFAPAVHTTGTKKNGCTPEGRRSQLQGALNQFIEVKTALNLLQNAVNESLRNRTRTVARIDPRNREQLS